MDLQSNRKLIRRRFSLVPKLEMGAETRRSFRNNREAKAVVEGKLVESTNTLQPQVFFERYLPRELMALICRQQHDGRPSITSTCAAAPALEESCLDECFRLIQTSSAQDYQRSEIKWSPAKKRKEMLLPDLRYIILHCSDGDATRKVAGFVSFMVTYEDGCEVIYCYEIHLSEPWQGRGIGKKLMGVVETIGQSVGVEKSMLTVFTSNERALKMYESLGYVEDEFSPGPRRLRNGTIKEPAYRILSKQLKGAKSQ